jgi:hypothetical protein
VYLKQHQTFEEASANSGQSSMMCTTLNGCIPALDICLQPNLKWLAIQMYYVDSNGGLVARGHSSLVFLLIGHDVDHDQFDLGEQGECVREKILIEQAGMTTDFPLFPDLFPHS